MSLNKEVKKLIRRVERQGWRVEERKSGYMCFSPDGVTMVSIHKTPSDHRAIRNSITELRKGGFDPDA